MPRAARLDLPGAIQHVSTRGVDRAAIYLSRTDRNAFMAILSRVVERHRWELLAYCLMGNHYHLMFQTPEANLAIGMQQLNANHAQRQNFFRGRTGHLFGGRYTSRLVGDDAHLLEAARYIVLNPVRAGLCRRPGEWEWSSYRATAGDAPSPAWLASKRLLEHFGTDLDRARERFTSFVADPSPQVNLLANCMGSDPIPSALSPAVSRRL